MRLLAVILCFAAINVLPQPDKSSAQHKDDSANKACSAITLQDNRKSQTEADAPNASPPRWYASSEWWLVIIAALTGLAVAYQAREMRLATEAMGVQATHMAGQLGEMQESRKIENRTLILQYRPKIVIRNAKALQFSFELGEPGECEMRFAMVNTGGSPAYIQQGSFVQLVSCIGHKVGKVELKEGDRRLMSQPTTLQPGEQITVEEVLPTGTINDLDWANFREGIQTEPLKYLFLMGTIYYMDDLNIPRATGISRKYQAKTETFEPQKDSESEYTD